MLNWSPAEGALVYEVMAIGNLGYVISYQTNETLLEAELPCGQLYTFTVTAQDDRCDSSVSLSAEFKTGMFFFKLCLLEINNYRDIVSLSNSTCPQAPVSQGMWRVSPTVRTILA